MISGSLGPVAAEALKHELSKLTVSRSRLERAEGALSEKVLKFENEEFKQNVVKGITNISEFAKLLVSTTLNFLPQKQQNDLLGQLKSMEFSDETQPITEEVNYVSDEFKSFYGCLFATRDIKTKTVTVAYCFGTLEFRIKTGFKSRLKKIFTGKELTSAEIEVIRKVYCRKRFLDHSLENGLIDQITFVE